MTLRSTIPKSLHMRLVAGLIVAVAVLAACANQGPTRTDTGPRQEERVQIVELVRDGQLTERDEFDRLILPADLARASIGGRLEVRADPFMVFFTTWTGSSPDPYCGYEYSPTDFGVDPDPLGSGEGEAESIGDSWFWICAR